MTGWTDFFTGSSSDRRHEEARSSLLPTRRSQEVPSAISSKEVTKVALRLKHQIENVIPCELSEESVTKPHSGIITASVIETARQAGGEENKSCVIFGLLICKKWFRRQSFLELWDADLHQLRAVACEIIAKRIIESEEDTEFLLEHLLLKRFSIYADGEDSPAANAIEKAVDLHALTVIGSSGYQKCVNHLWRGWLVQDDQDPSRFVPYEHKVNTSYWAHLDPDRIRVPKYQNSLQILFSIIFLGLYTGAINTINRNGDIDVVEAILYIFTAGFIFDEISKFSKVGRYYIGFWNIFNSTLYALLLVSFVTRMIALGYTVDSDPRKKYNTLSYNFLAFTAPMFWMRLLLYLDGFRFFGSMLVIVKVMMKESIIFFALLLVVLVGFLQGFIGMDYEDQELDATAFILSSMANAIMTSPEFDWEEWSRFAHPFGLILYYIFTFVVMVVLLNILIALYNSAYEDITSNAIDEFMALFAGKCLQFVRAPDENVFIPPLNLIEIIFLIIPFEWWLNSHRYEKLNDYVMAIVYSPVLVITAFMEQAEAKYVKENRRRGEEDEDTVEEWEQLDWKPEVEDTKWCERVKSTCTNVETEATIQEIRKVKQDIAELAKRLGKQVPDNDEE